MPVTFDDNIFNFKQLESEELIVVKVSEVNNMRILNQLRYLIPFVIYGEGLIFINT